jgi:hypothetical protein
MCEWRSNEERYVLANVENVVRIKEETIDDAKLEVTGYERLRVIFGGN